MDTATTRKKRVLKDAVDRIIEEGEGEREGGRWSVIVQVPPDERTTHRLVSTAADVLRRRNVSLTARDLLPVSQEALEDLNSVAGGDHITDRAQQVLTAGDTSLAVKLGFEASALADNLQPQSDNRALDQLLQNPIVHKALSETTERKVSEQAVPLTREERQPTLTSSRSVVLNIEKDDLARLPAETPQIQGVFPNRTLRLPPLTEVKNVPDKVQEEKTSSWGVHRVGALAVWGAYNVRGRGTRIAVLDTGVEANHPDLAGKVTSWAEFDADGYQVSDALSDAHDSDKHGTHCAGTIAGGRASGSWIGVAPEAELAVGLVLKGGSGTDAQILAGLDWAIRNRVDVISMSLGGLSLEVEPPSPYTETLIKAVVSGIPVVTAIGNEGGQTTGSPGNDWFAFSVGATDHADRAAGFSGGRTHVIRRSQYFRPDVLPLVYSKPEVSAPGVAIRSSVPNGDWAAFNGTSMATPHAAGAIALLLSATTIGSRVPPEQRALLIQDLLTGSVEELGESGQDHRYGFGRIDALRAIGFAKDRGY